MVFGIMLMINPSRAQLSLKSSPSDCPGEHVQVHISHESAFTGEICWFKIYCTPELIQESEFSKLAFLELVDMDNTSIVRKKILLNHGQGSGDFVIPDNLPTGIYYVLVYTRWMKNFGEQNFFCKGLVIINPNQPFHYEPVSEVLGPIHANTTRAIDPRNILEVIPDKKEYLKREQVKLKIRTNMDEGKSVDGTYSISIYRKEPSMYSDLQNNIIAEADEDAWKLNYLPDHNGILLSGKLSDLSGNALTGQTITLSLPGPGVEIKSSITNDQGNFHFLLDPASGDQDVVISLPGAGFKVELEDPFWNGFRRQPDNLVINLEPGSIEYLKEKFTHYQLQGRFGRPIRNPSIKNHSDSAVFYSTPLQTIVMDSYVSLDSLREYFYELVPSVKFVQRRYGLEVSIVDPQTMTYIEEKPGIFLDGVLYDNFPAIFNIPVENIHRMSILPNTYYYKDLTFGGIIDIHTKKSDFNSVPLLPNMTRFRFPIADAGEWKFTSPDYAMENSLKRIPDFRYLLHWESDIQVDNSGEASVQFYTGDVPGDYVIRVMGMSRDGEPLQTESEIHVSGSGD